MTREAGLMLLLWVRSQADSGKKGETDYFPAVQLDAVQSAAQEQFGKQSYRYGKGHILQNVDDVVAAAAQMKLPVIADVLDVATGAGHTGLYFAGLGHRVTLADNAQPMLDRATEAAAERGLKVTTCQHAAEKFPYADASFDLVSSRVAPHHFSSPPDFIHEVARVLRPGGYFLLIDGSVPDDEPEAEAWLHQVEKLRDPSHNRLLSPRAWSQLCLDAGLGVQTAELKTFKQPDLEWYFETANTPPDNRVAVRKLIETASENVKRCYQLGVEEGKIVWWWPRLTLIARR